MGKKKLYEENKSIFLNSQPAISIYSFYWLTVEEHKKSSKGCLVQLHPNGICNNDTEGQGANVNVS